MYIIFSLNLKNIKAGKYYLDIRMLKSFVDLEPLTKLLYPVPKRRGKQIGTITHPVEI